MAAVSLTVSTVKPLEIEYSSKFPNLRKKLLGHTFARFGKGKTWVGEVAQLDWETQ